jgi:hypothetical protein
MKFYNFLNENYDEDEARKILKILLKDCKPYIDILKKFNFAEYFLTGRRKPLASDPIIKRKVRKNRDALDTPDVIHKWVDNWFYKKFGIKARSQTVFCTSSYGQAMNYGSVYFLFPIGKFEVIWSKKHQDLFRRSYMDKGLEDYQEYFMDDFANTYVKGNPIDALNSGNEIMLYCKEYYLMRTKNNPVKDIVIDNLELGNYEI